MLSSKKHRFGRFLVLGAVLAVLLLGYYLQEHPAAGWTGAVEQIRAAIFGKPANKTTVHIDAPHIRQNPELPRGCEVTSLAMLLQSAGVHVDKMQLARNIPRVPYYSDHKYGNPNEGFVGSMEHMEQPGYGVYHGPLTALGHRYLGGRMVDLSGQSFTAVLDQLQKGIPVVVITNATFQPLDSSAFRYWNTGDGMVKMTRREHAVLVTGYDRDHIFFNNPLGAKNAAADRELFIRAWEQMGQQAISYRQAGLF